MRPPDPHKIAAWIVLGAGAAFTVGYGAAGPFVADMETIARFAELLARPRLPALGINLLALVVLPLAFFAWHLHLRSRRSLVATVLAVAGCGLTLPGVGYLVFVLPAAGRSMPIEEVRVLHAAVFDSAPFGLTLFAAGAFATAAYLVAGSALWADRLYPRWSVVAFMVAAPLLSFAPAVPVSALVFPVDMTGSVLLLAAGVGMAAGSRSLRGQEQPAAAP
jgi:hypothetical protein